MAQIAGYLEKFKSSDNDFRYMAANDLIEQLNKPDFILEDFLGHKVSNGVLDLIQDTSSHSEVKNIAVKCLGPLSCKVKPSTLGSMFSTLIELLKGSKPEMCELASLGVKTIVSVIPATCIDSKRILKSLFTSLVGFLTTSTSNETKYDLLEIIVEMMSRFGSFIFLTENSNPDNAIMSQSLQSFFALLKHPRPSLKKRSSLALGALAGYLTSDEFDKLNNGLMSELNSTSGSSGAAYEQARILIHCFVSISRADTARFGTCLPQIVPQILEHFKREDEELRDCSLQALESFALLCPTEMKNFVPQIAQLCLEFISYDPNYAEDMDGSDDDNEMTGDDEEEENENEFDDEFDDEFSNDDDNAWKVRRSCAKTLRSLISIYPENLQSFYDSASSKLIGRFSEREETVRVEVIQAFISLLRQTISQDAHLVQENSLHDIEYEAIGDISEGNIKRRKVESPQMNTPTVPKMTQQGIFDHLPKIVNKISKQLNSKSLPTQQACLSLLTELTRTLPGALGCYISKLTPGIQHVFTSETSGKASILTMGQSSLKLEALSFLRELFRTHHPGMFHDQLEWICPAVLQALGKNSSKYSGEAYLVCIEIIKSLRPISEEDSNTNDDSVNKVNLLKSIFNVIIESISDIDADQLTRERCTRTVAALIFHAGDLIPNESESTIRTLCDQASLEVNGQSAIQSLIIIMKSPKINWDDIEFSNEIHKSLATLFGVIVPNLRKTSRALRISTLECLVCIQRCLKGDIDASSFNALVKETGLIYQGNDIQEIFFILTILESSLSSDLPVETRSSNLETIFPSDQDMTLNKLALSSHLQGSASEKLSSFYGSVIKTAFEVNKNPDAYIDFMIQALTKPVVSGELEHFSSKMIYSNISRIISSAITAYVNKNSDQVPRFLDQFSSSILNSNASVNERYMSFQVLGLLSTKFSIANHIDLFQCALAAFEDSNAELRLEAACAMGQFTSSDVTNVFPKLVTLIREHEQHRYLSLHAFKEVIVHYASLDSHSDTVESFADEFWNILINDQAVLQSDESTRNVVAECLGILTLTNPEKFVPLLHGQLKSSSVFVRCVVISSIRSTFRSDSAKAKDQKKLTAQLGPYMADFLSLLKDEDINVRRLALNTLDVAAHQRSDLIQKVLPSIISLLVEETHVKKELVHVVAMGPYSYTVDDGLENRKAAYDCIYTLLDKCPRQLDMDSIITNQVISGLTDVQEVKLIAHMIIMRLSNNSPAYVRRYIDSLVVPMGADLKIKLKESALRHEAEQHSVLVRFTLRTLACLSQLASGHSFPKLDEIVTETQNGAHTKEYADAVESLKTKKL